MRKLLPANGKVDRNVMFIVDPPVTSVTSREGEGIPQRFDLAQNNPNPFNPATTIGYNLSKSTHVSLKIFDITGREVVTLVDKLQPAGS